MGHGESAIRELYWGENWERKWGERGLLNRFAKKWLAKKIEHEVWHLRIRTGFRLNSAWLPAASFGFISSSKSKGALAERADENGASSTVLDVVKAKIDSCILCSQLCAIRNFWFSGAFQLKHATLSCMGYKRLWFFQLPSKVVKSFMI